MDQFTRRLALSTNERFQYRPRAFHTIFDFVMGLGELRPELNTVELVDAHLVLSNIRDRIVTSPARRMNLAFGIAEWVGVMRGIDDLGFFTQFVQRYVDYSSNGATVDGAYGPRIVAQGQIDAVVKMLQKDPTSRRAVISIYQAGDLHGGGGKNTPCTLTLQFMIRDGRLLMITNMRSNDVVWGLTYDAFVFTLIQEYIAAHIGIPAGPYFHNAGSLHIYSRDFSLAARLHGERRWHNTMGPLGLVTTAELVALEAAMRDLRCNESAWDDAREAIGSATLRNFAEVCRIHVLAKGGHTEYAAQSVSRITDSTMRHMVRMWL